MKNGWIPKRLGEVLTPVARAVSPSPGSTYRQIGVRLWGEGAYERESIDGSQTRYSHLFEAAADDIIVNKIWARNGSVAVVPNTLSGCLASSEFPMFSHDPHRLDPRWIHWLAKTPGFWSQCDEKSRGTSGKNRIKPEQFLKVEIPLPELDEQKRVLARIEELSMSIETARRLRRDVESDMREMLLGAFREISEAVPFKKLRDVAPIIRRPVAVEPIANYAELGIRSFGKGTFHKPSLSGLEIGTKRVFKIEPGDLLFSNVFAWEGAIAVVTEKDLGRVGSHRFISCVPKGDVVTSRFLCFYFLSDEGLEKIRAASPGGALRNRTLGLEALESIDVPLPPISNQQWFDALQNEVDELKRLHDQTAAELTALLPSILDKAFKGEL